MHAILAALPPGTWTAYYDLAAVIGSHPAPVGTHLATKPVTNAHRVLTWNGGIAANFRWLDPNDTRELSSVLEAEGVRFTEAGLATPEQHLNARQLAALIGLDVGQASDEEPTDLI